MAESEVSATKLSMDPSAMKGDEELPAPKERRFQVGGYRITGPELATLACGALALAAAVALYLTAASDVAASACLALGVGVVPLVVFHVYALDDSAKRHNLAIEQANARHQRLLKALHALRKEVPTETAALQHVRFSGALEAQLELAVSRCRQAQHAFYTPHLLLALLDRPDELATESFERTRPGLANDVRADLQAWVDTEAAGPFRPFAWEERPDVALAHRLALHDGVPVVTHGYMLLGLLETDGNTVQGLRERLGEAFDVLLAHVRRSVKIGPREPTPGISVLDQAR